MSTEATASQRTETNIAVATNEVLKDLVKANPLQLSKLDLTTLDNDQLLEAAKAMQDRINDAVNGGLLVDKRTGIVYTGGSFIGNVGRPIKAMNVIPSAYKAKEDHISRAGVVELPEASVNKGHEALTTSVIGAIRFLLAGQEGNGVNLVGQRAKTRKGAAEAMGTIKGGLA